MQEAVCADRVLVMEKGKIVMEGKPAQIFCQVEKLKKYGLDVPQVTELAYLLAKDNVPLRKDILTVDEMVDCLCQLI